MPRLGDTLLKHIVTKETDRPESDIECATLTGSEKQISWAADIRASRMLVAKYRLGRGFCRQGIFEGVAVINPTV